MSLEKKRRTPMIMRLLLVLLLATAAYAQAGIGGGDILGVEAMPVRQLDYINRVARDWENPRFDEPVRLLLSKTKYPAEDKHLDVVLWLTPQSEGADVDGWLDLRIVDGRGRTLAQSRLSELHPTGTFFSLGFPDELAGRDAVLEATWIDGEEAKGRAEVAFAVRAPADVPQSGRVAMRIPNDTGARIANAPMTVGVPFPRGALSDEKNVRLVDEAGEEMGLQTRVTARWSRFGPVKWLLCDFTADLDGGPRELFLEYGPDVVRAERASMSVELTEGFPVVDAGRLRFDGSVWFDPAGEGAHVKVLGELGLRGAFVEHEDARFYRAPLAGGYEVEEAGPEKVVLRREGWYAEEDEGREFCKFVIRYVIHRDSPVLRVFHTWIFTGDGNRDRIRNMGWQFALPEGFECRGFLTAFDDEGAWRDGDYLLQHDHDRFDIADGNGIAERPGGRAAGAAAAAGADASVFFGVKDFWQNFPSELEFREGSLWFHNWPRHNRPASYERPVPEGDAFRHRYAHEGEVLDFRMPEEYAQDDIWAPATGGGRSGETHWDRDEPESANAQGIARTEEMFLYFADPAAEREAGARVIQGLNDETLRTVVDPAWVAASGAFGAIHHRDVENFPEDERIYDIVAHTPARWNERLGFYGMWLHGDLSAWGLNLTARTTPVYRAIRKNHHGWPYRWHPFARSGDPQLLKYAEAATRQMTDANFCHYVDERVHTLVGEERHRQVGWWDRSLFPWTGRMGPHLRSYTVDCSYLWHAYYLTGYARARDIALLWGERVRDDDLTLNIVHRGTRCMFHSYNLMYQATFDPWFLVAFHALSNLFTEVGQRGVPPSIEDGGTRWSAGFWRPGDREYIEFTGDENFKQRYLACVKPDQVSYSHEWGHGWHGTPRIEPNAFAWRLTGDEYFLARVAHEIDWARMTLYEGDPDYFRGHNLMGGVSPAIFAGWYMQMFPYGLRALADAGRRPGPVPNAFYQNHSTERVRVGDRTVSMLHPPEIAFRKSEGDAVPLYFQTLRGSESAHTYTVAGPGGETALSGEWALADRHSAEVPADAPAGVYRLRMEGGHAERIHWGALFVPVTPRDVPEVFLGEREEGGTRVGGPSGGEAQYWFMVPEGAESFWVEFPVVAGLRRMTIWNPDGERAWDINYLESDYDGPRPIRVETDVPSGHAGRLWRISLPGSNSGFLIDPAIPPAFSVSRPKWFDPDAAP